MLVPASVSTLGKAGPEGVNMTITEESDDKLFRRCVVNNAAYDYISRCNIEDLGITPPPSGLRIWLFNSLEASSSVMLHHGAVLRNDLIESFLGKFSRLVEFFMPDITIGTKDLRTYKDIYSATCHELAHSSHFAKVGTDYWDAYIRYVIESYLTSGGQLYGDGTGSGSGNCEVGEMWAYYMESKLSKDRYGSSFPILGTSWWFYPQIFHFMDERGLDQSRIYEALLPEVDSKTALKEALMRRYPDRQDMIGQVFSRY